MARGPRSVRSDGRVRRAAAPDRHHWPAVGDDIQAHGEVPDLVIACRRYSRRSQVQGAGQVTILTAGLPAVTRSSRFAATVHALHAPQRVQVAVMMPQSRQVSSSDRSGPRSGHPAPRRGCEGVGGAAVAPPRPPGWRSGAAPPGAERVPRWPPSPAPPRPPTRDARACRAQVRGGALLVGRQRATSLHDTATGDQRQDDAQRRSSPTASRSAGAGPPARAAPGSQVRRPRVGTRRVRLSVTPASLTYPVRPGPGPRRRPRPPRPPRGGAARGRRRDGSSGAGPCRPDVLSRSG